MRRTAMPARINRGLSRNGRRPFGASEGPRDRLGVMVVAVAGITETKCHRQGTKTRSDSSFVASCLRGSGPSSLLLHVQQAVQLAHELVDVAEVTIHRG